MFEMLKCWTEPKRADFLFEIALKISELSTNGWKLWEHSLAYAELVLKNAAAYKYIVYFLNFLLAIYHINLVFA